MRNGRALLLAQNPGQPGTFVAPLPLQAGSGNGSDDLAVGDVNGDGRGDIVLAASGAVAVFYQNANGGFDPVVFLAAGTRVSGVALADLDGDGHTDIVVANAGNSPAGGAGGQASPYCGRQVRALSAARIPWLPTARDASRSVT